MSYLNHALNEFRAAGWMDESGKFNDELQSSACQDVLDLLEVFSKQGHSGTSATYVISLFKRLAAFEQIAPLTGEDWEWVEICDDSTNNVTVHQNKRCSHVFKQSDRFNGQAYDIDGKVFYEMMLDDDGEPFKSFYTSLESHVPIEFPYTPKTEYIEKEAE